MKDNIILVLSLARQLQDKILAKEMDFGSITVSVTKTSKLYAVGISICKSSSYAVEQLAVTSYTPEEEVQKCINRLLELLSSKDSF